MPKKHEANSKFKTGPIVTWTAKVGYTARGTIYLIIGSLALLKSIGQGGESADSKDAVHSLLQAPFGIFLIWLLAFGLSAYSAWRIVQAFSNADGHSKDLKGYTIRAGLIGSAISHAGLAYYSFSIASSLIKDSGGGSGSKQNIIGFLLNLPLGIILVLLLALIVAGIGIAHFVKGYRQSYSKHLDLSATWKNILDPVCRYGLYARGFVFIILSLMIGTAAITQDPDEAGGMQEALQQLQKQPYGSYLLFIMSIGLLLFASYCFIEATARRINITDS